MKKVLGIDPDTTTIGWGVVQESAVGRLPHGIATRAGLIQTDPELPVQKRIHELAFELEVFLSRLGSRPFSAVVIESQRWRPRSKVDPQDLIHLAQVAGICVGMVLAFRPDVRILLPEPSDWKGSVPKDVFTARLRKRFMIDEPKKPRTPVAIVADGDTISEPLLPSKHTHAIDALGLAGWGLTQ